METSELIKQVKLRPAIWSATNRDNKNMAAAWQQICKMAWPDFTTRPVDEKRTKCLELQKKWKGLQQSFSRDRLRQKQGKDRGVPRSQYYDQLSFLAPIVDTKRATSGSSNGPGNAAPSPAESSTPTRDVTPSPGPSTPLPPASTLPLSSQERDAEEDRQFLMSLVSFMQDVPRSRRLALRSEILQVITKYTGGDPWPDRAPAMSQEY